MWIHAYNLSHTRCFRPAEAAFRSAPNVSSPLQGRTPFFILCLIGFATFFSSYLRIPVMPLFAATLGAGPAQVGMINGTFMLTAGLLSIPAGLIADRTGRKIPVLAGIMATALSSLLITQCHQPGQLAAAYVLFGAGLAAFAPGMLSLVADVVPPERLGQAYGWYTTAIYIAMTLGPACGGFLAKSLGLRQVFVVSAALLGLVTLLAVPLLPKSPPRHKTDLYAALAGCVELLHSRHLLACFLATAGSCIGFGVFLTFIPLYAASLGYDPAHVGLIFAAQALTNVIGRVPIGMATDRRDRRWIVAGGLFCLALAVATIGQTIRFEFLIFCSVLLGCGMALTFTAIGALIAELTPIVQRGLAMGIYNSCIYLGMMTGSTMMGMALRRIGYPLGFAVAGAVELATLFLFIMLIGRKTASVPP